MGRLPQSGVQSCDLRRSSSRGPVQVNFGVAEYPYIGHSVPYMVIQPQRSIVAHASRSIARLSAQTPEQIRAQRAANRTARILREHQPLQSRATHRVNRS